MQTHFYTPGFIMLLGRYFSIGKQVFETEASYYGKTSAVSQNSSQNVMRRRYSCLQWVGSDADIIIELGCGRGVSLNVLAEKATTVLGVDISEKHLKMAAEQCRTATNIHLVRGTCAHLPIANHAVDGAVSIKGPVTWDDIYLIETLRILKNGGRLYIEAVGEMNHLEAKVAFRSVSNCFCPHLSRMRRMIERLERLSVSIEHSEETIGQITFKSLEDWYWYQRSIWHKRGWPQEINMAEAMERFKSATLNDLGQVRLTFHLYTIQAIKRT